MSRALCCMSTHTSTTPALIVSSMSTASRKCLATLLRASCGHATNLRQRAVHGVRRRTGTRYLSSQQHMIRVSFSCRWQHGLHVLNIQNHKPHQSIVQQFTSEGNIRSRVRKASPIGLRHKTTCKFVLARSMKKAYSSLGDPVLIPAACLTSKNDRLISRNVSGRSGQYWMPACPPEHSTIRIHGREASCYSYMGHQWIRTQGNLLENLSYLCRLGEGLVDSHHFLIVEQAWYFAGIENAVNVF